MVVPGTICPADGRALEPVPFTPVGEVAAKVAAAREAQPAWAALGLDQRAKLLLGVARKIVEQRETAMGILADEMGREPSDTLMSELVIAMNYAKGAVTTARRALAPERVKLSPIDFPGKRATIEAVPRGVVGIIAPWNYPLLQFYKALYPALLSGNAVIMKPSEHTPRSGAWLHGLFAEALPDGVVQLVQGAGEQGAAVIDTVDAVTFTGSVGTGRKVSVRCAERMIPCSAELGGNDAAIVLADADLDRTVIGIAHWAMHNAGQDCASVERVYVVQSIADSFVERLGKVVGGLQVHPDGNGDLGPLQNEAQFAIVQQQVADAVEKGARVVCGGEPTGKGYGFLPTVLDACTAEMDAVDHETFGPVVCVIRVPDEKEAVRQANDTRYGLTASVWTKDLAKGERLARQLHTGVAMVNNHSFVGAIPQIPWTGTKETGTGVAASVHAYPTFVRRQTIVVDRSSKPDIFWFPANSDLLALGHAVSDLSLGSFGKALQLVGLLGKRTKAIQRFARGEGR